MFKKLRHKIANSLPVLFLINVSKQLKIPGFEGIPLYFVASFFIKRIKEGELQTRARSLAFSFLLALFPSIIFLFTLIPYIPIDDFQNKLLLLIKTLLPGNTYIAAYNTIEDIVRHQHSGLLSFGFFFALFVSTDGIMALMRWFNRSYHGKDNRPVWKQRFLSIGITLLLALLVILAIVLIIISELIYYYITSKELLLENIFHLLLLQIGKWFILITLCFTAISILYFFGPSKREKMKFVTAGSSLATFLLVATSLGFNYFVTNFGRYNKVYGSIGTLIIILIWLYINSLVMLIGYELNVAIRKAKDKGATSLPIQ
ncbi:MAG: YihY/virulence factor BrkB family protein [Bacteroidota bacterium]